MMRLVSLLVVLCGWCCSVLAQAAGGTEYALAGSSVMWLPHPGALFENPAELARLHQSEFLFNTTHFSSLASLSGTSFVPFLGTFAAGISNEEASTQYAVGFGRWVGASYAAGGVFTIAPQSDENVLFSLGATMHPADEPPMSGLHVGVSAVHLGKHFPANGGSLNAGGAYWIKPDLWRVQAAWRKNETEHAILLGTEVLLSDWLSVQGGTQSFKLFFAGVAIQSPSVRADVSIGKPGVVFSMKFPLSEPPAVQRDLEYGLGQVAFDDQRFREARQHFLAALEYDERFMEGRAMVARSTSARDSSIALCLQQGKVFEGRNNFLEALRRYTRILTMDPGHEEARQHLAGIEPKRRMFVQQFIAAGDSMRVRHDINRARQNYERVLDIDPENELAVDRMVEIEKMVKENIRQILTRGNALLSRDLLDEAEREYDRVLSFEPDNDAARSGLTALQSRRLSLQVEHGKTLFQDGKYLEALGLFNDVLKRDERNREAKTYLERTRESLQPEIDKLYKIGLQLYVKEDYKAAMDQWEKVLLINPTHKATIEYRKRAEQKLKALEQLR